MTPIEFMLRHVKWWIYGLSIGVSYHRIAIAPVAASLAFLDCTPTRPVPIISFHSYLIRTFLIMVVLRWISPYYNSPQDSIMQGLLMAVVHLMIPL
ncbi:MAG: hypothetical protein R2728_04075 [Chitinophagales bacterium]